MFIKGSKVSNDIVYIVPFLLRGVKLGAMALHCFILEKLCLSITCMPGSLLGLLFQSHPHPSHPSPPSTHTTPGQSGYSPRLTPEIVCPVLCMIPVQKETFFECGFQLSVPIMGNIVGEHEPGTISLLVGQSAQLSMSE